MCIRDVVLIVSFLVHFTTIFVGRFDGSRDLQLHGNLLPLLFHSCSEILSGWLIGEYACARERERNTKRRDTGRRVSGWVSVTEASMTCTRPLLNQLQVNSCAPSRRCSTARAIAMRGKRAVDDWWG